MGGLMNCANALVAADALSATAIGTGALNPKGVEVEAGCPKPANVLNFCTDGA